MMPWHKIVVLGFGASLVVGCTITTSDGGADSGFWDETGGAKGTGGSSSQGGATATGGTAAGGATTIVICDPASETNPCAKCLQTADNDPVEPGMCTDYKPCAAVTGCTNIINDMSTCMSNHVDSTYGTLLPNAKSDCLAATPAITANTPAGLAANTFWNAIENGWCADYCWAI